MKIAVRSLIYLLLGVPALLVLGCQLGPRQRSGAEPLKVGAAEIDITPPVGHRMAGYFDERLSTGVHDSLIAKAIVLRQSLRPAEGSYEVTNSRVKPGVGEMLVDAAVKSLKEVKD